MDDMEKRKSLLFDLQNLDQKEVFQFLEKVRYYQTKFITKLVKDFMIEQNITETTSYDDIKTIIGLYLKDQLKYKTKENHTNSSPDITTALTALLSSVMMNNQSTPQNSLPLSLNSGVSVSNAFNTESNNFPPPVQKEQSNVNSSDYDILPESFDADDDDYTSSMMSGFMQMAK